MRLNAVTRFPFSLSLSLCSPFVSSAVENDDRTNIERRREGGNEGVDILSLVDESGALFGGQFETSPITRELLVPPIIRPNIQLYAQRRNSLANGVIKTLHTEREREMADCRTVWNDSRIESFHPSRHQPSNAKHRHQSDSRFETTVYTYTYTDGHPNILVDAFKVAQLLLV